MNDMHSLVYIQVKYQVKLAICVVLVEQTQPVVPSAPPASYGQQPCQLDAYPPQPVPTDPNARNTTTTTTYVTTTETVSYYYL